LYELGRRLTIGEARPLHFAESVRNTGIGLVDAVDDDRNQEWLFRSHQMRPIDSKFPRSVKDDATQRRRVA
jgi:hypothetical protein